MVSDWGQCSAKSGAPWESRDSSCDSASENIQKADQVLSCRWYYRLFAVCYAVSSFLTKFRLNFAPKFRSPAAHLSSTSSVYEWFVSPSHMWKPSEMENHDTKRKNQKLFKPLRSILRTFRAFHVVTLQGALFSLHLLLHPLGVQRGLVCKSIHPKMSELYVRIYIKEFSAASWSN